MDTRDISCWFGEDSNNFFFFNWFESGLQTLLFESFCVGPGENWCLLLLPSPRRGQLPKVMAQAGGRGSTLWHAELQLLHALIFGLETSWMLPWWLSKPRHWLTTTASTCVFPSNHNLTWCQAALLSPYKKLLNWSISLWFCHHPSLPLSRLFWAPQRQPPASVLLSHPWGMLLRAVKHCVATSLLAKRMLQNWKCPLRRN